MSRQERSAGFIVFRHEAGSDARRLYLLLNYGRHWDLPKGHVEKGEDDLSAALRELREETGIADAEVVDDFRRQITYWFRSRPKGLIHKTVVFFLARTHSDRIVLSHEHVGWEFLPYDAAVQRLTYESARSVLEAAEKHLSRLSADVRTS